MPSARARAALFASLALAPLLRAQDAGAPAGMERVYFDEARPDGTLIGGYTFLPAVDREALANFRVVWPFQTIVNNGAPRNRVDIVLVGDGYTAPQLTTYAVHALAAANALFAQEPFKTYRAYFNVHRVDVVSNESGVDNDPVQGIFRDTALNMAYWCGGTERLLCVDVPLAFAAANNAPDVQQIFAIANSSKYGGAGYPSSDVATFAGANSLSTEIAIHEIGHSLGDLADEYDYGGAETYTGPELGPVDVSIFTAAQMLANQTKWFRWMGDPAGLWDGPVDTYEGANYSVHGVYRPSPNSKMRALNRPFNAPSAEGLIINVYRVARPIDAVSPPTTQTLGRTDVVTVTPQQPVGHDLSVQWFLNGQPIPGATGRTFPLSTVFLDPGASALSVRVRDDTPMVRNEAARAQWMTETRQWTVSAPAIACQMIFTQQPQSASIFFNGSAQFTVQTAQQGPCAVAYQWMRNGQAVVDGGHYSGAQTATLSVTHGAKSDSGTFTCRIDNGLYAATSQPASLTVAGCPGDANGDLMVNFADLNVVLFLFGQTGENLPGDFNHDGVINFADLNLLLANFGLVC